MTIDGTPVVLTQATVTGRESSFFTVASGATRSVTVTYADPPPNSFPIAQDDAATTKIDESVTVSVLANDSDPDGDPLVVSRLAQPASGSVSIVSTGTTVLYTPQAGFCGTDGFGYTVNDGRGGTATAGVTVTVTCGGTRTHTTVADFSGCSPELGTQVTQSGDGEVRLAGALGDATAVRA